MENNSNLVAICAIAAPVIVSLINAFFTICQKNIDNKQEITKIYFEHMQTKYEICIHSLASFLGGFDSYATSLENIQPIVDLYPYTSKRAQYLIDKLCLKNTNSTEFYKYSKELLDILTSELLSLNKQKLR